MFKVGDILKIKEGSRYNTSEKYRNLFYRVVELITEHNCLILAAYADKSLSHCLERRITVSMDIFELADSGKKRNLPSWW